ncbi:coenzyme f390 synthetase [Streptomyces sp. BP-8]|uniref:Coenzyme f390 synthetase n=1 Tax=Streptomyces sirii TaxID=3127701 RepID=A0ABZ2QVR7_9ACTN
MGATINPQDVTHGLYDDNPLAELIEGFCLAPAADGALESRPVIHVQLRPGVRLSAVEADRLAKACQHGVRRQLAVTAREMGQLAEDCPSAHEIAITLHTYGAGPFTGGPAGERGRSGPDAPDRP